MTQYYCYILTNKSKSTLYIGVTNDLIRRTAEHKADVLEGFTKKYRVHSLVWFEIYEDVEAAILREKQLKKWNRPWKNQLIEEKNPEWKDLYYTIVG